MKVQKILLFPELILIVTKIFKEIIKEGRNGCKNRLKEEQMKIKNLQNKSKKINHKKMIKNNNLKYYNIINIKGF